jgi:DNA replication protein DnaC
MDFDAIFNSLDSKVPHAKSEYIGDDGLLRCGVCNAKVQTRVNILGKEKTVRCVCDCVIKEREAFEERKRHEERERRRRVCFAESNMHNWTFENDNKENERLSNAMLNYADQFSDFLKDGRGLLLSGTVGTGKTYFAACIANRLIDNGYRVMMTNFARLTNQIQGMFDGKQEFIDDLNRYPLLIIDDLGAERKSEYMQEMVFNIIDSRYRSGRPFIITTNLTLDEIKKPQELAYSRIYDRILERCFPVEASGNSRRRQMVRNTYYDTKEKLGL